MWTSTCYCSAEGSDRIKSLGPDPLLTEIDIAARREQPRRILTFGPYEISPHCAFSCTQDPQCLFRGDLILNTGDEDGLFLTTAIVGQRLQLTANLSSEIPLKLLHVDNPVSRMLLDETSQHENLRYDYISLSVRNYTSVIKIFSMSIAGRVSWPPQPARDDLAWDQIDVLDDAV